MLMFSPFTTFEQRHDNNKAQPKHSAEEQPSQQTEIAELKAQLASIQQQLHKLADEMK